MLFQTVEFLIFLVTVFLLHWCGPVRMRVPVLVAASMFFYGWWDWRFLGLIVGSSIVDYCAGLGLERVKSTVGRRWIVAASVSANLGALGLFKYYGFFAREFSALMAGFGVEVGWVTTDLILPVGISFYTLQTMSYTFDVYGGKIGTCRNFMQFLAYVSFFPQLVAGPIERARDLLPQFQSPRRFEMAVAKDGARQMLLGLFKKVVIADSCGSLADQAFETAGSNSAFGAGVGVAAFAFQIYADFSGYSDMAIGMAKMFGIRLTTNFRSPYLATGIVDFWRRWHISLSTWFRDYLYIPLGGGRHGRVRKVLNTTAVFAVSGLWHGANWTYLLWGMWHAVLYVPAVLWSGVGAKGSAHEEGIAPPKLRQFPLVAGGFVLVCIGWVLFRSASVSEALSYYGDFLSMDGKAPGFGRWLPVTVVGLMALEWIHGRRAHAMDIGHWNPWLRRGCYLGMVLFIVMYGKFGETPFIYFQF